MKKLILAFGLTFLSLNLSAEIVTGEKCGDDCSWTLDTETGKLTVSGTGNMYSFEFVKTQTALYSGTHAAQTTAPWGAYSGDITNITIESGITKIGAYAFYNTAVTSADISDSVTDIDTGAFQYARRLSDVQLSENLYDIGIAAFFNTNIDSLIIPESVSSVKRNALMMVKNPVIEGDAEIDIDAFWGSTSGSPVAPESMYCLSSNESCDALKQNDEIGDKIISFDKQGGVYILDYGTENEKYYYSSTDMAGKTNECTKVLGECKRDVLEAKGICQGSSCDTFIQSDGNYMLKYGGKTYQDINALLRGDYDRRRIYTIEEANFVAGDKNRVSITYR